MDPRRFSDKIALQRKKQEDQERMFRDIFNASKEETNLSAPAFAPHGARLEQDKESQQIRVQQMYARMQGLPDNHLAMDQTMSSASPASPSPALGDVVGELYEMRLSSPKTDRRSRPRTPSSNPNSTTSPESKQHLSTPGSPRPTGGRRRAGSESKPVSVEAARNAWTQSQLPPSPLVARRRLMTVDPDLYEMGGEGDAGGATTTTGRKMRGSGRKRAMSDSTAFKRAAVASAGKAAAAAAAYHAAMTASLGSGSGAGSAAGSAGASGANSSTTTPTPGTPTSFHVPFASSNLPQSFWNPSDQQQQLQLQQQQQQQSGSPLFDVSQSQRHLMTSAPELGYDDYGSSGTAPAASVSAAPQGDIYASRQQQLATLRQQHQQRVNALRQQQQQQQAVVDAAALSASSAVPLDGSGASPVRSDDMSLQQQLIFQQQLYMQQQLYQQRHQNTYDQPPQDQLQHQLHQQQHQQLQPQRHQSADALFSPNLQPGPDSYAEEDLGSFLAQLDPQPNGTHIIKSTNDLSNTSTTVTTGGTNSNAHRIPQPSTTTSSGSSIAPATTSSAPSASSDPNNDVLSHEDMQTVEGIIMGDDPLLADNILSSFNEEELYSLDSTSP